MIRNARFLNIQSFCSRLPKRTLLLPLPRSSPLAIMPMRGKRKSSALAEPSLVVDPAIPNGVNGVNGVNGIGRPSKRRTGPEISTSVPEPAPVIEAAAKAAASSSKAKPRKAQKSDPNHAEIVKREEVPGPEPPAGAQRPNGTVEEAAKTVDETGDPAVDDVGPAAEEEVKEALARPPPVNSDYLPLPWKGRLGYACLNTYLRNATPAVFSSRTCRIQSILDHRHPLQNPDEPEHATKNRPDKTKPAEIWRGQKYVEELGLANARDIAKMVRWNEKYGIRFMRLSSEMFPFASHEEYGYKLASFAAETLAEAGRVAGKLGHRLTTHPGQFTQLGSPRKVVVDNAIRDLEFHAEMLSLLKLPPQQDRDAVMILHMGGMFGSKEETLDRFRANYAGLSDGVKKRLVLENDDMCWSVHDLLPICEELNIPFVLDFHHHNIIFDASQIREGTKDIVELFPRIIATWRRKNITPKMHYSEPTPAAITPRQRRKHSPRVATLPPCPPDMDLMIEAKDKEQAVFELMRTFKLPGYEKANDVIPFIRDDETRLAKPYTKKELKDRAAAAARGEPLIERTDYVVPADEVGMGGPLGRVYWPPTMEAWLRPEKIVRDATPKKGPSGVAKVMKEEEGDGDEGLAKKAAKGAATVKEERVNGASTKVKAPAQAQTKAPAKAPAKAPTKVATPRKTPTKQAAPAQPVLSSESESEMSEESSEDMSDLSEPARAPAAGRKAAKPRTPAVPARASRSRSKR